MVSGFFGLAMLASQEPREVPHAKNIFGGVAFAFGTALIAHIYRYEYDIYDMLFSREFVCFAVLCVLNISAISLWEHAARTPDIETKAGDELTLTLPLILLAAVSLGHALLDSELSTRSFFYAILTGAGLLYVLNRMRAGFPLATLRVLADIAMLLPVLVFLAANR
jgi:hypothetical protein